MSKARDVVGALALRIIERIENEGGIYFDLCEPPTLTDEARAIIEDEVGPPLEALRRLVYGPGLTGPEGWRAKCLRDAVASAKEVLAKAEGSQP